MTSFLRERRVAYIPRAQRAILEYTLGQLSHHRLASRATLSKSRSGFMEQVHIMNDHSRKKKEKK